MNLEAGLFGANVVVGDCPPVREYFGDKVWYCDPNDELNIADALVEAIGAPRGLRELSSAVRREYTWSRVADLQAKLYTDTLSRVAVS